MIFSSVAHAALFAAALVGFSQTKTFEEYQEAVPVEVINENELRQMMRGERNAPKPLPAPQQKADRVAETNERKPDAPIAKQEVEVPPPPQRDSAAEKATQEKAAAAQAQKDEQERAVREARAAEAQKQREIAEKQRIASAAAAAAAAEKARASAAEKARAEAEAKKEEEAEERREAELERQRKQEEARKAAEAKKIADEKKAAEDKKRKEAEARALKEKLEREEEEAERKQAELDKQKKAEEARKAAEAKKIADAKRAADEKARREAEIKQAAQSDQKSFDPSDIQKILQNKQRASTPGSTGPQPAKQASLGTQTGNAAKLNPSQREALIGILREQMTRCLSIPPGSNPSARPTIRVGLNQDGSLAGAPSLAGGDAAVGAASMRAIRACAPYRIPAKFSEFYGDWRSLQITIDISDL